MPRLRVNGELIEVDNRDFLTFLSAIGGSSYGLAEYLHRFHLLGLPDVRGTLSKNQLIREIENERSIKSEIGDPELGQAYHVYCKALSRLVGIDDEMIRWATKRFMLSPVQTDEGKKKLYRKLTTQLNRALSHGIQAKWLAEPEYQELCKRSEQVMSAITSAKHSLDERLLGLTEASRETPPTSGISSSPGARLAFTGNPIEFRAPPPTEFGDQRAKDIIDAADAEVEPKQAIALLHKALRYGRDGIQASKAYLGIGMRYEDLGNDKRAIEYYTKSIEAGLTNVFVLFWRGRVYLRQNRLAEAQLDLESALISGLQSPEREEAQKYLLELRQ